MDLTAEQIAYLCAVAVGAVGAVIAIVYPGPGSAPRWARRVWRRFARALER